MKNEVNYNKVVSFVKGNPNHCSGTILCLSNEHVRQPLCHAYLCLRLYRNRVKQETIVGDRQEESPAKLQLPIKAGRMGGSAQEKLDLLEQKIKFTLRPLINSIKTSGMNRERRMELDDLLLEITNLQQSLEGSFEEEGSTENKIRLTGLVDYLYALIKGSTIQVKLPERRQDIRQEVHQDVEPADAASKVQKIRILNLSVGGMRLHTLKRLKVGSVFHTKLNSSRHGIIPLRGEVVWLRPKQQGKGYIVGIHFLPLEKDVQRALAGFLEEYGTGEYVEEN